GSHTGTKRLPSYWFDSRRRYFVASYGTARAIAVDVVAIPAHVIGNLKRIAQRRTDRGVPHFLKDLVYQSALWPGNRKYEIRKSYVSELSANRSRRERATQ